MKNIQFQKNVRDTSKQFKKLYAGFIKNARLCLVVMSCFASSHFYEIIHLELKYRGTHPFPHIYILELSM